VNPNPYQCSAGMDESRPHDLDFPCPKCDGEMRKGYVVPTGTMFWITPDQQDRVIFPSSAIDGTGPGFLRLKRLEALWCVTCNLVVFRHGSSAT